MALTVRISDDDIEKLKKYSGERTASKALTQSAIRAMWLESQLEEVKADCFVLMDQIKYQQEVIDLVLPLVTQLQEVAGQRGILDSQMDDMKGKYSAKRHHYLTW